MHTLTADVAIIGGGAAGCYAARNLQKRGLKPLIICKGLVGKSGASLFAGNLESNAQTNFTQVLNVAPVTDSFDGPATPLLITTMTVTPISLSPIFPGTITSITTSATASSRQ